MNITREKGFINLNKYFTTKYNKPIENINDISNEISVEKLGARTKFWFDFNGTKTLYKAQFENTYEAYAELIVSELARQLGYKAAYYDLAKMKLSPNQDTIGVVTKNFKKDNNKYLVGTEIILTVYRDVISKNPQMMEYYGLNGLNEISVINKLNNLENIWDILLIYFSSNPHCQEIVAKLMDDIVSYLMLDILTLQGDRHSDNWTVEITKNGEVNLAPLYDNSNAFNLSRNKAFSSIVENLQIYERTNNLKKPRLYNRILGQIYHPNMLLTVFPREIQGNNVKSQELLKNFINTSASDYKERFEKMLNFLEENGIEKVFSAIETQIECSIPQDIKETLPKIINIHLQEIRKNFDIQKWKENTL